MVFWDAKISSKVQWEPRQNTMKPLNQWTDSELFDEWFAMPMEGPVYPGIRTRPMSDEEHDWNMDNAVVEFFDKVEAREKKRVEIEAYNRKAAAIKKRIVSSIRKKNT